MWHPKLTVGVGAAAPMTTWDRLAPSANETTQDKNLPCA